MSPPGPPAARRRPPRNPSRIGPIAILIQLQPEKGSDVRTIVRIGNGNVPAKPVPGRIQPCMYRIVRTVGPVALPRPAAGAVIDRAPGRIKKRVEGFVLIVVGLGQKPG